MSHFEKNNTLTSVALLRSGRASDSESRGPGFDLHKRHRVVSLSKTHTLPTELVKPRKRWLRPDITEKLLTGALTFKTNKHIQVTLCDVPQSYPIY